tara:strand:- start:333 stop:548 length:216 start_codon:yes stop_codon:yes gene_type:complete
MSDVSKKKKRLQELNLPNTDNIKRYVLELENIIKSKLTDEVIINSNELRSYYLLRQRQLIDLIKEFLEINT